MYRILAQDMTKRRAEPFHQTEEVRRMEVATTLVGARHAVSLLERIGRGLMGRRRRNIGDLVTDSLVFTAKRRKDL